MSEASTSTIHWEDESSCLRTRAVVKHVFKRVKASSASELQEKGMMEELSEGGSHPTVVPDEAVVKIREAKEALESLPGSGCEPLCYRPNFLRVRCHLPTLNDVTEERNRWT